MTTGIETSYRFGGDASELLAELQRARKGLDLTSKSAVTANDLMSGSVQAAAQQVSRLGSAQATAAKMATQSASAMGRQAAAAQSLAKSTALTSQELATLNFTASDIVASLSTGASPFTILLQQGGQVRDSFGGFGNLFSKLGQVFTPFRLAVLGAAGAVGTFGLAALQGYNESRKLADSLALTGNYAGMTAGKFDAMATSIAGLTDRPIGDVRDALQGLVSTGRFGPESIDEVTRAVVNLQRFSGESTEDIVKNFASMSSGVAKWAADANRSYHYLTVEQFKYIRQLEAQGQREEAVRVNMQAFNASLDKQKQNLGFLETSWRGVKTAASAAWDAMMNLGREDTLEEQLGKLDRRLKALAPRSSSGSLNAYDTQLKVQLEAERENLKARIDLSNVAAKAKAKIAADEQKKIDELASGHQDALLGVERAGINARAAAADRAREEIRIALNRGYDERLIDISDYVASRYAIEKASITARSQLIDAEIALEKKRQPENATGRVAQEAKLIELQAKRHGVLKDLDRLNESHRTGGLIPAARDIVESPQSSFRAIEAAQTEAVLKGLEDRRNASSEGARQLIETNRQLGIGLIQDDRQRGLAQIAEEERVMRLRLDLGALNADERKRVEDDLAQWRALRERELTEQLKPEYERQLEAWRDTNRLMRDSLNDFQAGWLRSSEDAWTQYATTGKLSVKSLADFVISEFARMAFRRNIAQGASGIGGWIAGLMGLGGGASGTTGNNPSAFVASARGNAFDAGVHAYAKGGILGPMGGLLTRPTIFPMANGGIGLGGEAGTEAVMPLGRTRNGRMGVLLAGGGAGGQPVAPIVNISTPVGMTATTSSKRDERGGFTIEVMVQQVEDRIAGRMNSGVGLTSAIERRFGLNSGNGAPQRGRA